MIAVSGKLSISSANCEIPLPQVFAASLDNCDPSCLAAVDACDVDRRISVHARRSLPGCIRCRNCTIAIGCERLWASVSICNSSPPRLVVRARISNTEAVVGLQRLGGRLAVEQAGEQHGGGEVAQAIGRPVDGTVLGKQRFGTVDQKIADAALHHCQRGRHQHRGGPASIAAIIVVRISSSLVPAIHSNS